MGFYGMLLMMFMSLSLIHCTRVVWVTSKLQLLDKIPDLNYTYFFVIDVIFLIFFPYTMLFTTSILSKFTQRTLLLIINLFLQSFLLIALSLILQSDYSFLTIFPSVFILLPISQAISYVIILVNVQKVFDEANKTQKFLDILMSLWHSFAGIGHIMGFSMGLLLSRGAFDLNPIDKYAIPLLITAGLLFFTAILITCFHREKPLYVKEYVLPPEILTHELTSSSYLSLSPNISSLLSIEKPYKDISECSYYSRFSRESSKYPLSKSQQTEFYWILKQILKYSLNFAGIKTLYWGLLMWGAVFLNLNNREGEVWLGDMSMILYEAGQILMALLLSIKRLEYKKTLMIYPLALLFASSGLLFLFITDPTHLVYYMVFLIIGGFLGLLYISIGEIICEGLIMEADLTISLKGMKKCAVGIDIMGNIMTAGLIFIMQYMLEFLMIWFCGLALILTIYWGIACWKEFHKNEKYYYSGNSTNKNNNSAF